MISPHSSRRRQAVQCIVASVLGILVALTLAACTASDPAASPASPANPSTTPEPTQPVDDGATATAPPAPTATAAPVPTATPTATATPTSTATPLPTSTPIPRDPDAAEFLQLASSFAMDSPIVDTAIVPACSPAIDRRDSQPPHLETRCPNGTPVLAGKPGRIVALGRHEPGESTSAAPASKPWSWADTTAHGDWIAIDHDLTQIDDRGVDLTTVIMGLTLGDDLHLGELVVAESVLGITGERPLLWQPWVQSELFDEVPERLPPPDFAEAEALAEIITEEFHPPVDQPCRVNLGAPSDLPNAARPYRNGTHQGVDMACVQAGHRAWAALDGEVVFVMRDYEDARPSDRGSVLNIASRVGTTPHWTLNFLYGNFVVIESEIDGHEVITIYAHLADVEPSVVVGDTIERGHHLGEVGNVGTNDSANGRTTGLGSVHLHWEIFVDGLWLGEGLNFSETSSVYRTLFCSPPTVMHGC